MPGEMPEYFDNIVLGQYAMTGVPLKVYANSRYYIIPSPEDVDDPLIGYGMTPAGKMEPFDYRDIQHIMVSGNKVDISTYVKALGDELEGVKKASDAKGGEEKKEGGEEEKPAGGEEGGEEAKASPFESFDPYAKIWSLKALYEISKDEYNAQEDALKAEMEAGKAKIDAAKDKMSDLKKQPIDDSVIKEDSMNDDVVFTIDDEKLDQMVNSRFGSRLDFQEVDGDSYYILNQRDFDRLVDLADSSGFDVDYENSEDSVLSIYDNVNENHISEPYMFQVGDLVRNVNPQCKHYGSVGIVNSIQALDNDMGDVIKYIVTNYGDTFKPGMALMKTPDQLKLFN